MSGSDAPVLRHDVTTNDWVLYAPARAERPNAFVTGQTRVVDAAVTCPFCPGNEHLTPTEVARASDATGGWRVRVVPNKYPAFDRSIASGPVAITPVFHEMGGYGVHEVVVEAPEHTTRLSELSSDHVEALLGVLHGRFVALSREPRVRSVILFKNHGRAAGCSLSHPHWQIAATPVVPRLLRTRHAIATEYFDLTAKNLYAALLEAELDAKVRVLDANEAFVAFLPFASQLPYQVRIQPRVPRASFAAADEAGFRPLATLLRDVLRRLDGALGDPAFNLTVNTVTVGDEDEPYFAWHIDVLPRLTTPAGFELGSGMSINPVLPETAAAALAAVELDRGSVQVSRGG